MRAATSDLCVQTLCDVQRLELSGSDSIRWPHTTVLFSRFVPFQMSAMAYFSVCLSVVVFTTSGSAGVLISGSPSPPERVPPIRSLTQCLGNAPFCQLVPCSPIIGRESASRLEVNGGLGIPALVICNHQLTNPVFLRLACNESGYRQWLNPIGLVEPSDQREICVRQHETYTPPIKLRYKSGQ